MHEDIMDFSPTLCTYSGDSILAPALPLHSTEEGIITFGFEILLAQSFHPGTCQEVTINANRALCRHHLQSPKLRIVYFFCSVIVGLRISCTTLQKLLNFGIPISSDPLTILLANQNSWRSSLPLPGTGEGRTSRLEGPLGTALFFPFRNLSPHQCSEDAGTFTSNMNFVKNTNDNK